MLFVVNGNKQTLVQGLWELELTLQTGSDSANKSTTALSLLFRKWLGSRAAERRGVYWTAQGRGRHPPVPGVQLVSTDHHISRNHVLLPSGGTSTGQAHHKSWWQSWGSSRWFATMFSHICQPAVERLEKQGGSLARCFGVTDGRDPASLLYSHQFI